MNGNEKIQQTVFISDQNAVVVQAITRMKTRNVKQTLNENQNLHKIAF